MTRRACQINRDQDRDPGQGKEEDPGQEWEWE